jgi:hypothetical protein
MGVSYDESIRHSMCEVNEKIRQLGTKKSEERGNLPRMDADARGGWDLAGGRRKSAIAGVEAIGGTSKSFGCRSRILGCM